MPRSLTGAAAALALFVVSCETSPSGSVTDGGVVDAPSLDPADVPVVTDTVQPAPLDTPGPVDAQPAMPSRSFTIVVLPDTQFYSRHYPEIFEKQAKWIVEQRNARQIAFALHEGDIVDINESEAEWQVGARMLHMLDGIVPYVLATGNHDTSTAMGKMREAPLMNKYFPVSMFMKNPWWKGTFEPDQIQNTYQIIRGGDRDWLTLSLEFGPRNEVLAWADRILTENASLPAIIVTHAYMYSDNQRYNWAKHGDEGQKDNPIRYGLPGTTNDGEMMYEKLVSKHDNVKLVVSGHVALKTAGRLTSTRPSGTRVHQLLANFQLCYGIATPTNECQLPGADPSFYRGGGGFLRLMEFDPMKGTVSVKTYSPYLDQWKTTPEHQFELTLD